MTLNTAPTASLAAIVGHENVSSRDTEGAFSVDGLAPAAIASPGTYEEVAGVMAFASDAGLAVIPRGAGTSIQLGNVPSRYDLALSLARLTGIVEYEPADLTVTCRAGTPLTTVQDALEKHGQTLSLGPVPAGATIGGILAANTIGRYVHSRGRPRDVTIGLRVVSADGRLTRVGGKVVKNVAGYDLGKLYIGCLGTLGVIVEATFKVTTAPATARTLALRFEDARVVCELAAEIERRGLVAASIELVQHTDELTLAIELAGTPNAVARSEREILELAKLRGGQPAEDQASFETDQSPLRLRIALLPTAVPSLVAALRELEQPPALIAWPTAGLVHAGWEGESNHLGTITEVRAQLKPEMSLVVERCSAEVKQEIDVFGEPPPSFALMRQIKQQFDPNGILSPGRFVGRL